MAASVKIMELGFVQEVEPWRLRSPQFPSKVGGRPAWLGEAGVPEPEAVQCGLCGKPLAFLLQVYAPCTGSFHRSVFIFCCRDPQCHQGAERRCYKVFRNQLPRKNDTYSYGPPPDSPPPASKDSISFQLKCGLRLCRVCGCLGPKTCSKCHKVNYCSRVHQLMDWKLQHKQLCNESFAFEQLKHESTNPKPPSHPQSPLQIEGRTKIRSTGTSAMECSTKQHPLGRKPSGLQEKTQDPPLLNIA